VLQQDELLACISRYQVANSSTLSALHADILQALHVQRERLENTIQASLKKPSIDSAHRELRDALDRISHDMVERLTELADKLDMTVQEQRQLTSESLRARTEKKSQRLLKSLQYSGMERRKLTIPESANETLEWIYEDDTFKLKSFLGDNTPFLCIFGKPGCGKSTLMRFLSTDRRTREALGTFASSSTLIVAEHFFWYAGETMQRSHTGLLQSLLYGVLAEDPALAAVLCPERWCGDMRGLSHGWSRAELLESLKNINSLSNAKVFLLIDGLDEYYPHDNHRLLIEDVQELLQVSNLKLCVSSRPWPVFEAAFKSMPSIVLEDHTEKTSRPMPKMNYFVPPWRSVRGIPRAIRPQLKSLTLLRRLLQMLGECSCGSTWLCEPCQSV
jgi:hypothetical protein